MTTKADCGRHTAQGPRRLVSAAIQAPAVVTADPFAAPAPASDPEPKGRTVTARWVGDPDDPRRHFTRFFHGTTVVLDEGEEILPAEETGAKRAHWNMGHGTMAYATGTEDDGWRWAELAWNNTDGGRPRVYEVEPVGAWLGDDEDDAGSLAVMSPHGWRVVRAVGFPPEWGGEDADWE
ncbi:NAD(+)--rifampin ADP-ribosyltransferase [Euzebya pacifica]|uniref:NAD(+)--rifampin ADP-ribosyltransferase n=1 Tax=Euzebya pacifica TaxID=1608957 RepID=UPI0013DED7E1|nr:NAD(+)--rifampin ADP-ribosyltransferase [Euzebya pacifica]